MAHSSGISGNEKLRLEISKAKQSNYRVLSIAIENESFVVEQLIEPHLDWRLDYKAFTDELTKSRKSDCLYIFFNKKENDASEDEWIMINWVPECTNVRNKMLYASSRAAVKKEFGENALKYDISFTCLDDLEKENLEYTLKNYSTPPPLTLMEMEKEMTSELSHVGLQSGTTNFVGISFSLDAKGSEFVKKFNEGVSNYVQFSIDLEKEIILGEVDGVFKMPEEIKSVCKSEDSRYHIYRFTYSHENTDYCVNFFIHTIGGYKSSIKSRMLYSSCKPGFIDRLVSDYKINFKSKLEIDDLEELNQKDLINSLHPKIQQKQLYFSKPKGPGGRGPARLTK